MRLELWHIGFVLIPALILLHLRVAPITKVEESFNIQAAHDFLTYGLPFQNAAHKINAFYDHVKYPGAVPRTFIGALAVAGVSNPFIQLFNLSLPQQQAIVRAVLGLFNAASILVYASGVRNAYGRVTALWFIALQASQFHINFYASRPLPNMFAFALTTIALRFTLPEPATRMPPSKRLKLALYLMSMVAIIFRAEVALLLAGFCLQALLRTSSLSAAISTTRHILLPSILTATVAGLTLTVTIDTFMWRSPRLLWPELAAFLSNIFPPPGSQGASAWGTSPWHWYLTSALPRLLSSPLLLIYPLLPLLSSTLRTRLLHANTLPLLTYLALYSLLPHKETRFLFPLLPILTTHLALAASHLTTTTTLSHTSTLLPNHILHTFLILTTLLTTLTSHLILLPLSALTYPGAHALHLLHAHADTLHPPVRDLHVHLCNLALQTGVTHFLEVPPPSKPLIYLPGAVDASRPELRSGGMRVWYDKSDGTGSKEGMEEGWWGKWDYVVVERREDVVGEMEGWRWGVVGRVEGMGRPKILSAKEQGEDGGGKGRDGIVKLLRRMYGDGWFGKVVVGMYEAVKAVGTKVTGGRWVGWETETVLVVMKRSRVVDETVKVVEPISRPRKEAVA